MTSQIVAMGGGGFSMDEYNRPTAIDRYLLEISPVASPLVCFVPTASADDPRYINSFLNAYGQLGVRTMVLTLWEDAARSVARLEAADVVVVGGGHTVNLLALWDAHGVSDRIRTMAAESDVVLGGFSAGANAWFRGCITDTFGDLRPYTGGLGLLEGSFCCHFDGEVDRAPTYTDAVASGDLPGGYAADDGAGVHFTGTTFHKAIAERPRARVSRMEPTAEPTASGVLVEPLRIELI
ncbi:Type 1 glutamine amidotransferase-like domain-containing protein [Propionicicella superfundia]|uniref:Type 1 glutamine amidotransferase-like domain-containing protein n=1 Tax=Propionicicella superfundia TaxID=348582 RepID=UPI00048D2733|nr:Type 1 glutamine amidotransferase-like domain-containing protein [Propionicicella superfundia]